MSFQRVLILNFPKISIDAPPLAPALLSEICRKNNIEYDFIDCNLEFFQQLSKELNDEILGNFSEQLIHSLSDSAQNWVNQYFNNLAKKCQNYDLIAVCVFSHHSIPLVTEFLTKQRKNILSKIVIGGAGIASYYPQQQHFYQYVYEKELIDYWILGEGEIGFENLILKKIPCESVNNTTKNNLDNFDFVPVPNLDKFKIDDYTRAGKRMIGVEGSRGCVKRCTFCDIWNTWGAYKYKDGNKLAEEILMLRKKYNIDHFWFNDSLINGSMKAFRSFTTHLSKNRSNNFTWSSQAIVRSRSSRDEEDFQLLKDSGCETLAVGVESLSQPVRFHMGKKFTDDDLDHFLNLAQKYNISIFIMLIVGYPTETSKDFARTLEQLEKYQHLADDGTISGLRIGGTMSLLPEVPVYKMKEELGIQQADDKKYHAITWARGENTLKKRTEWRLLIEDRARLLGYNCADNEMHIENKLLQFLNIINNESITVNSHLYN